MLKPDQVLNKAILTAEHQTTKRALGICPACRVVGRLAPDPRGDKCWPIVSGCRCEPLQAPMPEPLS